MIALVALVCAAPFASAWVAYYFIQPNAGKSYGELLETRPLAPLVLPAADAEKWSARRYPTSRGESGRVRESSNARNRT